AHEIGHQLLMGLHDGLDKNGHRGKLNILVDYYNAAVDGDQTDDKKWRNLVNIMNEKGTNVPDGTDPNTGLPVPPAKAGNKAGTTDRFFFHSSDVKYMRTRKSSPGHGK